MYHIVDNAEYSALALASGQWKATILALDVEEENWIPDRVPGGTDQYQGPPWVTERDEDWPVVEWGDKVYIFDRTGHFPAEFTTTISLKTAWIKRVANSQ